MSIDKRARLKQWLESGEARLHPLTFSQRELWETSPVPVTDPSHHICCIINIRGLVTLKDCHTALQRVGERQEGLRTSFLPGKDKPVQMVRSTGEPSFFFRELSSAECQPEAIEELAQGVYAKPFDLLQGPLYRAEMFRLSADDHRIVLSIHHSIADGWTLGVFVNDLCGAYLHGILGSTEPIPPVPLTYTAWGAAERAQWTPAELQRCGEFWKGTLAGRRRLWNHGEGASHHLQRIVSGAPAGLTTAVKDLAKRNGATLFSTLLAIFQATLARWTGVDDIVVGTPMANRGNQRVRETMGYCSGVIPLRGQVDHTRSVQDSIRTVHSATTDAFAHAMPFVELMHLLGESPRPGYNPLFEVRFALQNHPVPDISIPNLSAQLRMRSTGTPRLDLGCEITEQDDALEIVWLFRDAMFSSEEIQELDRRYQAALSGACRSPESRIELALC